MKQSYVDARVSLARFAFIPVMLISIFVLAVALLLILPDTALASQPNRQNQILPLIHLQEALSSIPLPSPTASLNSNSNSDQNTQSQQAINTANNFVTFAGVFVEVVAVILGVLTFVATVVGVLGFFQVSRIKRSLAGIEKSRGEAERFRAEIEVEVKRVNELRVEFEASNTRVNGLLTESEANNARINELRTRFEGELGKVTLHTAHMEQEIKQLDKRIESEGQKFIEAAYYYSEGSKLYRSGDNHHAIEFYLRALKLLPTSLSILERIGRAYSNLNDTENAVKYFNQALAIDSEDETVLRSLSLLFRSTEPEKAIAYLKDIVHKNPQAFEAWDFLGLCYRDQLIRNQELIKDQTLIDEAINAHEPALAIKKRPETEFYLGILLYYSPKGDKIRAKELLLSAYNGTLLQEHDLRIRQVWKILIHVGALIVTDDKVEALSVFESLVEYITTKRIREGVQMHLRFLLEGTGHTDWLPNFIASMR